jgi:hypothetical protein
MSHWKKLDLVLVTSTEPYLFITDRQQSPFNVSKSFEMADFTSAQVAECNARHGSPLLEDEVSRLFELLHGHPYLTRRALYLVSGKDPQMHPSDMLASAPDESGPFGDHLRHHLLNILHVPDLVSAFRDIVLRRGAIDKHLFERLRGAGLVRWDERSDAVPRCKLYEIYFGRQFHA